MTAGDRGCAVRAAAARAGLNPVLRTVRAGLGPGGTVLLHDSDRASAPGSWRAALAALPELVAGCRAAGLTVGPLAEHGVRGASRR